MLLIGGPGVGLWSSVDYADTSLCYAVILRHMRIQVLNKKVSMMFCAALITKGRVDSYIERICIRAATALHGPRTSGSDPDLSGSDRRPMTP
jgi:hypothetical protein